MFSLERIFDDLTDTVTEGVNRLLDREIRIGVTGFSRGGKTAFLTSLVNAVCNFDRQDSAARLPRFAEYEREGIFYGGVVANHDLSVPAFPYQECYDALVGVSPHWPVPTEGLSEIRLEVKFADRRLLVPGAHRSLYIDLWDYPGEWLLDLMLLDLSYEQFSALMRTQVQKLLKLIPAGETLLALGAALKPDKSPHPRELRQAVESYVSWLRECKARGLTMVVPGRFVLPGNLQGAPLLEFVPWLGQKVSRAPQGSLYQTLQQRYEAYRREVVERFYRECFSALDRQVVLIDCFQALRGGEEVFHNVNETLQALLKNFSYGDNNLLTRIFSPRIDKVIFAATKADQVTFAEQPHLLSLLQSLVSPAARQVAAAGIKCEYLVLAAIAATRCFELEYQGRLTQVLSTGREGEKWYNPGEFPAQWSLEAMEHFQRFFLHKELPPPPLGDGDPIPAQNLDIMLSYMLRDKLA
ncbi:MAG: YcjX family protein [Succinivibrio sp.]|nr:YcjX family protein [Succinivibrio sp.]